MELGDDVGNEWPDGSEEFARYVASWLEKYGTLIDALVAARDDDQQDAVHALLRSTPLVDLFAAWQLWEEWSAVSEADGDMPLIPFLGEQRLVKLWYALWGARAYPLPGGGYEYVV